MCAFIRSISFSLGTVMLCSLVLLTGCPKGQPSEGQPSYMDALSDFVFVGSGTYDPMSVPVHGMKEIPLPSQFKAGYQYIFHLRNSEQKTDIYKTLLTKLQSKGIKIISANASVGDRYVGGPDFHISFQGEDFKGSIFNKLDGQIVNDETLVKQWSVDDYILVLESESRQR